MKSKNLFIVSTHSFVDLITNSSTELYVCDGKKTIDAINDLLRKLLIHHDEVSGETHKFGDVFRQPLEISNYTFQMHNFPEQLREDYYKYHERRYSRYYFQDDDQDPEKMELENKEHDIRKKYYELKENKSEEECEDLFKKELDEIDKLWTDYGARTLKSELHLFINFLGVNEFSQEEITLAKQHCENEIKDHIGRNEGQYGRLRNQFNSEKVQDAFDNFYLFESWGIDIKKGDILIYSAEDNSIPYEIMESINRYLGARSYHLG